jgi:hypothetical protein
MKTLTRRGSVNIQPVPFYMHHIPAAQKLLYIIITAAPIMPMAATAPATRLLCLGAPAVTTCVVELVVEDPVTVAGFVVMVAGLVTVDPVPTAGFVVTDEVPFLMTEDTMYLPADVVDALMTEEVPFLLAVMLADLLT